MIDLDEKIVFFGDLFKGRLDNEMLQDAIEYVGHGERGLGKVRISGEILLG
ncbi:MafI family immunity protein [Enterobacter roggenkampii]|uniref:MafI family immunity protein n=1 Tax=Enterobacter roggenkampii TaxID=1812935 RepID=UPI001B374F3B|nr:MafI family immunity protein [Enterobacter roggenkampii]MBQ0301196.1 MafI family immunity protein [Enterobacter roggenkampii]